MPKRKAPILTRKPKHLLLRPLKVDLKTLFKVLSESVTHIATAQWPSLALDAANSLAALGVSADINELSYQLIKRSLVISLFELLSDSGIQLSSKSETVLDSETHQFEIMLSGIELDKRLFSNPTELPLLRDVKKLLAQWLKKYGATQQAAQAISERLPSYFAYSLNNEWAHNTKHYQPIIDAIDTPFARATEIEWAWSTYLALLQKRINESVFEEPFSLAQIYIPLNAYYFAEVPGHDIGMSEKRRRRIVVSLKAELDTWLVDSSAHNAIRVISGGPGSGKSSFVKMFAAHVAAEGHTKVLFVPLHLIDPGRSLVDEIGRFVRDEGILLQSPLDPESSEAKLLIIFDGLDELATQGKAATEIARAFIREVEVTVEKRNLSGVKLRVLISGRELVVQNNESEFRKPKQVLTLLPYYVPGTSERKNQRISADGEEQYEPNPLLNQDLRQLWWKKYGTLSGKGYSALPTELSRHDLDEITAQPLLNYLVALSYTRERLDFTKDVNLNAIYADLVAAVHERGYEKRRTYGPIRQMTLADFTRVLEEIGIAAWHGDGRTTTVREIEEHCKDSGVGRLLDIFQEGARSGVTRLLAAFFFRQHGHRPSGDPTFVFTHKSFGEYLAARRLVRAAERIASELEKRITDPDAGWDERDALRHWAQVCGPSAVTKYLYPFVLGEIKLRPTDVLMRWQEHFTRLFCFVLRHAMPMEQLSTNTFRQAILHANNAEEGLLVVLNCCARTTMQQSVLVLPEPTILGAWFRRLQGQRVSPESSLTAFCLSFLKAPGSVFDIADLYGAELSYSDLSKGSFHYTCLIGANLVCTNLRGAILQFSNLERASLVDADLRQADLTGANLKGADFSGANLAGAILANADLSQANFSGAKIDGVVLEDRHPARNNDVEPESNVVTLRDRLRKRTARTAPVEN